MGNKDFEICGNCVHRDHANEIIAPVKRGYETVWVKLAPCLCNAVEPEAGNPGDAVVYFSENGHCRYHADAFKKSEEFMVTCSLADEQWA